MKMKCFAGMMLGLMMFPGLYSCTRQPLPEYNAVAMTVWHDSRNSERLMFGKGSDDCFVIRMLDDGSYTAHKFDYRLDGDNIEVYRHQEDGTKLTMSGTVDGKRMRLHMSGMEYFYVAETHSSTLNAGQKTHNNARTALDNTAWCGDNKEVIIFRTGGEAYYIFNYEPEENKRVTVQKYAIFDINGSDIKIKTYLPIGYGGTFEGKIDGDRITALWENSFEHVYIKEKY